MGYVSSQEGRWVWRGWFFRDGLKIENPPKKSGTLKKKNVGVFFNLTKHTMLLQVCMISCRWYPVGGFSQHRCEIPERGNLVPYKNEWTHRLRWCVMWSRVSLFQDLHRSLKSVSTWDFWKGHILKAWNIEKYNSPAKPHLSKLLTVF